MINIKDIVNRRYDGNKPISFEYIIKDLQGPYDETQELRIWFEKVNPAEYYGYDVNKPAYKVFTFIDNHIPGNDVGVYQKIYAMPKSDMPLEMVVATGLNLLRSAFQEEASYREMLSYTIADIIKDM